MNLTRWDPFRELEDFSKGLNQWFGQPMMRRLKGLVTAPSGCLSPVSFLRRAHSSAPAPRV